MRRTVLTAVATALLFATHAPFAVAHSSHHIVASPIAGSPTELPVVKTGALVMNGLFVNSDGALVVPTPAKPGKGWTVSFEGETYPAAVVSVFPTYGITVLKIARQKPFRVLPLAQKQAVTNAKLTLVGNPAGAESVSSEAVVQRVRRRIAEQKLDGSYYEVSAVGNAAPTPGSILLDSETGMVYGLLVSATGEDGTRFVLHSSTISERLASANVTIGEGEAPVNASIEFAAGQRIDTPIRWMEFRAATEGREDAARARSLQEWRKNTGFWINTFTSPEIAGDKCFFGATNGVLYSVDLKTMQRDWAFRDELPMFYPPTIGPSQVLISSGGLVLQSYTEAGSDDVFSALLGQNRRTSKSIIEWGTINCVDKSSGVFRWEHRTHFPSQPVIVGDKVAFGGLDVVGVLNLSDGKPVWEKNEQGGDGNARYFAIAGADADHIWALMMPTKLTGKGMRSDPFRLEQAGDASLACLSMKASSLQGDSKLTPIWSVPIHLPKTKTALAGTVMMSPDKKICYGTTAREVFAVDAQAGKMLWHAPVFSSGEYAGTTVLGDRYLYCTTSANQLVAVSVVDGSVAWTFDKATAPLSVPLYREGLLYIGSMDTRIYAVDGQTGALVWKYETQGKICGQPRMVGDKLYAMSDDGRLMEVVLPQ